MPSDCTVALRPSGNSTSARSSYTTEQGNVKDSTKVVGANGQVTKETRVAEGEEVTQVPCIHSPPVQLAPAQG